MPIDLEIDHHRRLVTATAKGALHLPDVAACFAKFISSAADRFERWRARGRAGQSQSSRRRRAVWSAPISSRGFRQPTGRRNCLSRNIQRHRHQEFIRFLNTVEAKGPKRKAIHAIVDNYGTHKHPKVREWLARRPRWTFHFTPTSASWLNAVEGFFAKLSRRRLKRGVFRSLTDLQAANNRFVAETNIQPKPFVWTADPKKIIATVRRGHQVLDSFH